MSQQSLKKSSKDTKLKRTNSLLKRVQKTAHTYGLWEKNNIVLIGLSGGPDSTCLLDILATLRKKYNFTLYGAHVNYHLRSNDSDDDELFVRELAKKYKIELFVSQQSLRSKECSEEQFRRIRYTFFEKVLQEIQGTSIAVGHNKNDQAETVLLHLLRGSSLNGLGAIRPHNNSVIRPLLEISRENILRYLEDKAIASRQDLSNQDNLFTRNKIRNTLMPYLEQEYNPTAIDTLARFATIAAQDYSFIRTEAVKKKLYTKVTASKLKFSVEAFLKLHPSLKREVFRLMCFELKQSLSNIHFGHIEECFKILSSKKNKVQTFSFTGLKLVRRGDTVTITQTKK